MRVRTKRTLRSWITLAAACSPVVISLASSLASNSAAVAAPPSLPPLHFSPFGAEQQLIPGTETPTFLQPRPIQTMNPLFVLPTQPFGELGQNVAIPGSFPSHRQPLPPSAKAAGERRQPLMPQPGFTKGPKHRRPLGW